MRGWRLVVVEPLWLVACGLWLVGVASGSGGLPGALAAWLAEVEYSNFAERRAR
jgi:hypothetical protein